MKSLIKVENVNVYNITRAVYSARNPLNSWGKSDSNLEKDILGKEDLSLAKRLYKAGTEHRKYLRQIFVSMDITAPLYWWKQADQYRINVTTNSCSTMHMIQAKEFELDDFSIDDFEMLGEWKDAFSSVIDDCEKLRQAYTKTKDKRYWRMLIQLLPTSYNQKRTITMNYENVVTIIKQRTGHKLDEWSQFIDVLKELPYIKEIMDEN